MTNNIKEKIQKILAKANGTDNEEEAAIFLAKAEALMEQHQIDLDDLGEDDPMGRYVGLTGTSSSPTWQRHLLNVVAKYFGATTVRTLRGGAFELHILGAESARMTVELMWPFILEQVRKEGRKEAKAMSLSSEQAIRRVANALTIRVQEILASERERKVETKTVAARNALVVRGTALSNYLGEQFPHLVKTKSRGIGTNDIARQAAGRVSLHRQTGGASTLRIGG